MFRKCLAIAALATAAATAVTSAAAGPASIRPTTPPLNHASQWWTHPSGCEYSRAGRPGETVWFLIVNTARKGCPTYIATRTYGGVYKQNAPVFGG